MPAYSQYFSSYFSNYFGITNPNPGYFVRPYFTNYFNVLPNQDAGEGAARKRKYFYELEQILLARAAAAKRKLALENIEQASEAKRQEFREVRKLRTPAKPEPFLARVPPEVHAEVDRWEARANRLELLAILRELKRLREARKVEAEELQKLQAEIDQFAALDFMAALMFTTADEEAAEAFMLGLMELH